MLRRTGNRYDGSGEGIKLHASAQAANATKLSAVMKRAITSLQADSADIQLNVCPA